MRTVFLTAALVAVSLSAAPAQTSPSPAAAASPAAPNPAPTSLFEFARGRIGAMLRTGHADPAWFSASFLAQLPTSRLDAIIAQITGGLGAYKSIDGTSGDYTVHFEKGTDEVLVRLDADNKIDSIFFKQPLMQAASLDDALRALAALKPPGGALSYVIREGRSERAALDASAPLGIGSAFKLAVLAALRDEINHGRRRWAEVVPLDPRWKSLPTGVIRTWPDGTPLTVATYAAEMISISDNTAADVLVRLDGLAALAPYASRNVPFLTTHEMFTLKSTPGDAARAKYLAATTPAARATVLRTVDAMPLPPLTSLVTTPILAVEWHYSVRELCDLMSRVADLPIMSINPGLPEAALFRRVAFKGGSDFGVINLTMELTTKHGSTLCFSATLNDPNKGVDEKSFATAFSSALSTLADR